MVDNSAMQHLEVQGGQARIASRRIGSGTDRTMEMKPARSEGFAWTPFGSAVTVVAFALIPMTTSSDLPYPFWPAGYVCTRHSDF